MSIDVNETKLAELDDAHTAAHNAFMDHVRACYGCRHRGVDCQDVAPLKERLRETEAAVTAARTADR